MMKNSMMRIISKMMILVVVIVGITSFEKPTYAVEDIRMDYTYSANGWYTVGGYNLWVMGEPSNTAIAGVDNEDKEHIKVQPTSNRSWDRWLIQVSKRFKGLTPGDQYSVEWPIAAEKSEGVIGISDTYVSSGEIKLTGYLQTVAFSFVADSDGTAMLTIGMGSIDIDNSIDFYRPTIKDSKGNVVYWSSEEETEQVTTSEKGNEKIFVLNDLEVLQNVGERFSLSGKYAYGKPNQTEEEINKIQWLSSDEKVAVIEGFTYSEVDDIFTVSTFTVKVKAKSAGIATIKGITSYGESVECQIIVSDNPEDGLDHSLDLKQGKDTFSFTNSANSFGISSGGTIGLDEHLIDLLKGFSEADKIAMKNEINSKWGGSCYGMSAMVYKNCIKTINLSDIQSNAQNLYDLNTPGTNEKLKQSIGLYQAGQSTSLNNNERARVSKQPINSILSTIINYMDNIENTNKPVVLTYVWICDPEKLYNDNTEDDGEAWSGHTVLAYGIEKSGAPYMFDGNEYKYKIKVIDPNVLYPNEISDNNCIYISEDYSDFIIPVSHTTSDSNTKYSLHAQKGEGLLGDTWITFATDNEELIQPTRSADVVTTVIDVPAGHTMVNGEHIVGMIGTCEGMIGSSMLSYGETSRLQVFMQDDSKANIKTLDNNPVGYINGFGAMYVTSQTNSEIGFNSKGVVLKNTSGNYMIDCAVNETNDNIKSNNIEIAGTGNKKISVTFDERGVVLEGDEISGTTITTDKGSVTIDTEKDSVIITETDEGITYEEKQSSTTQEETTANRNYETTSSNEKITSAIEKTDKKKSVVVSPKGSKIKKIKKAKKSLKVSWMKVKNVNGYQIQYSTSSKFKKAKKITIKKAKTTSRTIKKLKAKKKYYVRIRTYISVNGKKKYSNWSKKKSKKTK